MATNGSSTKKLSSNHSTLSGPNNNGSASKKLKTETGGIQTSQTNAPKAKAAIKPKAKTDNLDDSDMELLSKNKTKGPKVTLSYSKKKIGKTKKNCLF
jgi:hypothetical protein